MTEEKTLAFLSIWMGSVLFAICLFVSILVPLTRESTGAVGAGMGGGLFGIVAGVWMWKDLKKPKTD